MKTYIFLISIGLTLLAQAESSKDSPRLQKGLERFPQADINGDGVLTMAEAKKFRKNRKENTPDGKVEAPDLKDVQGNAKSTSHIYKTVGEYQLHLFVDMPKEHKADSKSPAIVFFHGGGFKSGSEKQFEKHAAYLAERGMVAIRVRYRLTKDPSVEIRDCVEDAISAMRWVRANAGMLGVDPDRVAAGGGSAGGYLSVATLLIEHVNAKSDPVGVSAKPNALVLFNPGFGAPNRKAGGDPRDKDGKGELSQYVKPNQPPMIQFFGTNDPFLPGAKEFIEVYNNAGNRCELITYEGEGHSFFNKDEYYGLTIAETDKFLTGLGWLAKMKKTP